MEQLQYALKYNISIVLFVEAFKQNGSFKRDLYLNKLNKFNIITFQGHVYEPSSNKIGQAPWY